LWLRYSGRISIPDHCSASSLRGPVKVAASLLYQRARSFIGAGADNCFKTVYGRYRQLPIRGKKRLKLRTRMSGAATKPFLAIIIFFASGSLAFGQAGSTGGTIGKQDKSISGGAEANGPDTKPTRKVNRAPDGLSRKRSQDEPSGTPKTFRNPTLRGVGVDWCMSAEMSGCGQVAATTWCRSKGFSKATDFKWKMKSPVYRQGDNEICKGFCGGFTQVTCE
jgi:hypothetical protein